MKTFVLYIFMFSARTLVNFMLYEAIVIKINKVNFFDKITIDMNFSSINFLFLFLPLVLLFYFLLKPKYRNIVLILSSFIFYFLGEKAFTVLLLFSCVFNYLTGKFIEKAATDKIKKYILTTGIFINILLLSIFKYLNFFIEQINLLFNHFNIMFLIEPFDIHLPVGISFFTFQAVSYLIDIYRKDIKASKLFNFTLYLSMFAQLVAGPIVRYKQIQNDLEKRFIKFENFYEGIKRFIFGLSKKVIIADTLSYCADSIFALQINELNFFVCVLGAVCYTFQIFFDFSGYSDMAIGLGKMFGFNFPENFNYPYISKSIKEFWRRWHISLSGWFRDYLYIPLGGSKCSKRRTYLNIMIVFILTGLWHGASWNFIIWGVFNGILIIFERVFEKIFRKIPLFFLHNYFLVTMISGWVIFRCEDLNSAINYLKTMYGFKGFLGYEELLNYLNIELIFTLFIAFILSLPIIPFVQKYIPKKVNMFLEVSFCTMLFIISASYVAVNTYQPFIYFRF